MTSSSSGTTTWAMLAWFVLVSACQEGITIDIDQTPAGTTFEVVAKPDFEACIATAYVYPEKPDDSPPIWSIERLDPRICVNKVIYGAPVKGFGVGKEGTALVRGRLYRLALLGPGFNESRSFSAP